MAKYTRFTQAITLGLLMQCIHLLDASENLQQDPRSIVQRLGVACRLRGGSSRWSRRSRKLGLHEDSENLFGDGEEDKSSFWSSSEEGGPGAHAQRREHGRGYMDWSSLTSTEDVADLPYVKHKGHHGFVMSVAVHQGRVFTGGMDKSVRVWDSATGETVAELETKEREEANLLPGAVTALAIAGGCVWGGTNNGVLHVWDLDSLELVAQLGADEDGVPEEQRHAGGIEALAVLDSVAGRAWAGGTQGPAVLTGCGDGAVRLWAADETRRCLAALKGHSVGAFALCLSDEHPDQLLTGAQDGTIRVWDLASLRCVRVIETDGTLPVHAIARIGSSVFTAPEDGSVTVWSALTWEVTGHLEGHGVFYEVVGEGVAAEGGSPTAWRKTPVTTLLPWRAPPGWDGARASGKRRREASGEGSMLLVSCGDNTLRVWDVEKGVCLQVLEGHRGPVWSVAADGDGSLWSVSFDQTLRHWPMKHLR